MLGPKADRSLNTTPVRSLEKHSDRDLFFEGILGKTLLNTDKASLKVFTRCLLKNKILLDSSIVIATSKTYKDLPSLHRAFT